MKPVRVLIRLVMLLLVFPLSALHAQCRDSVLQLSPRCGTMIDSFEVRYYHLFTVPPDFIEGYFLRDSSGSIMFAYRQRPEARVIRLPVDADRFAQLSQSVERADHVRPDGRALADTAERTAGGRVVLQWADKRSVTGECLFADINGIVLVTAAGEEAFSWSAGTGVRVLPEFGTSTWALVRGGAAAGVVFGLALGERGPETLLMALAGASVGIVFGVLSDMIWSASVAMHPVESVLDRLAIIDALQRGARIPCGTPELKARLASLHADGRVMP